MPRARVARSSASPRSLIRAATSSIPSAHLTAKTGPGIICTASGDGCRSADRSPSSIAPGTAGCWSSEWKDSPREAEWKRAYKEINSFERQLRDFGAILAKFWIHISREEQLRRFEERKAIGYKAWKLTEEDWRNREKVGSLRRSGGGDAGKNQHRHRAVDTRRRQRQVLGANAKSWRRWLRFSLPK